MNNPIFSKGLAIVKKVGTRLAGSDIFFYALFWLMFLVVAGTLEQRNVGLYQAQQKYFSPLFFKIGPIPLPSAYLTLAVIFVGLVCKLIFRPLWTRYNLGINITHIGALFLLVGAFLTAEFSHEGNLALQEGQSSDFIVDYHDLELAVADTSPTSFDQVTTFPKSWLSPGKVISYSTLPFKIEVTAMYENSEAVRRAVPAGEDFHGFGKMFSVNAAALNKDEFKNQAALLFKISGAGQGVDGNYAVFEQMPIVQTIKTPRGTFSIEIRKAMTRLPFTVKLLEFNKISYPSTDMAKGFRSFVEVTDGGITQRSLIQMNEPLRYKGYIFYQASFSESTEGKVSVLSVVKNSGALFPYISSIIMCIGLMIDLISKIPRLIAKKGREA